MLRLIPAAATMARGGASRAARADWRAPAEAPPTGAARRPAGRSAPVAVLREAGRTRAVRERARERARSERASVPASRAVTLTCDLT